MNTKIHKKYYISFVAIIILSLIGYLIYYITSNIYKNSNYVKDTKKEENKNTIPNNLPNKLSINTEILGIDRNVIISSNSNTNSIESNSLKISKGVSYLIVIASTILLLLVLVVVGYILSIIL